MPYYGRIGTSEGIDISKTIASKECDIYGCLYFLDKEFKFQSNVCNGCHQVLMISIRFNDMAVLNIQGVDYCCAIN